MKTESVMWLFPVFFMIHEFEELIFLPSWLKRNSGLIAKRFPRIYHRMGSHLNSMSTRGFALGVAEEFVILSTVTLVSVEQGLYSFFASFLIMYCLHVLIHCVQSVALRRYIPALGTGIISVAYSLFALDRLNTAFTLDHTSILMVTPILLVVMAANLALVHIVMSWFEKRGHDRGVSADK